jgi:hypothetical protein
MVVHFEHGGNAGLSEPIGCYQLLEGVQEVPLACELPLGFFLFPFQESFQ